MPGEYSLDRLKNDLDLLSQTWLVIGQIQMLIFVSVHGQPPTLHRYSLLLLRLAMLHSYCKWNGLKWPSEVSLGHLGQT